jgi:hypothetical protein
LLLLSLAALMLALASCDGSGGGLRVLSTNVSDGATIVPGSRGLSEPPGALEVRYSLGSAMDVEARIEGPADGLLFRERVTAGSHVLRFNGVLQYAIAGGAEAERRVVPAGDYRLVLEAGGASQAVNFSVAPTDTEPPSIERLTLHPERISPNSDAVDDVAELTFRTGSTSTLSVLMTSENGDEIRLKGGQEVPAGEQNVLISGQTPAGEVLPDGTYTVTVRASDDAGNLLTSSRRLTVEAGGEPEISVVRVEIEPGEITLGNSIQVSITVRNTGKVPLRTHGPDPGYEYTTNDSYSSIEGGKWVDQAGLWRVGVDWDGNSGGGAAYRYPFRWGFGKTLMPAEEVTTGGRIRILKQESRMWFYGGVLQEGIRIVRDRLGRTPVDVDF